MVSGGEREGKEEGGERLEEGGGREGREGRGEGREGRRGKEVGGGVCVWGGGGME